MHRTRAIRSQLIQWRDLEFNLLNEGHSEGSADKQRGSVA